MKKLMALTLALVLALSLGVTALAKDAPIPEGAKVVREIHLRADGVVDNAAEARTIRKLLPYK